MGVWLEDARRKTTEYDKRLCRRVTYRKSWIRFAAVFMSEMRALENHMHLLRLQP